MRKKIMASINIGYLIVCGSLLIILGLIAIPLPIIPGILFVVIGVSMLKKGIKKLNWQEIKEIKNIKHSITINHSKIQKSIKAGL